MNFGSFEGVYLSIVNFELKLFENICILIDLSSIEVNVIIVSVLEYVIDLGDIYFVK